ncbi:hypothetical protein KAS31_01465, partial [Candidatus Parcubacteria bacterium]|nr:hypothetical protein [Candidatus Parcubacteria bacterium]
MKKEIKDRFKTLPQFVRDAIYEDNVSNAIGRIGDDFINNDKDKSEILKNAIGLIILKDIKIEQLAEIIREGLKLDDKESIEMSLIILCEILYPINNYFPGIEDEILKLGGEIPKEKPKQLTEQLLKREEEMEKMKELEEEKERKRMADTIVSKPIEDLVDRFKAVGEQQIGNQESIKLKSMAVPMRPLIKYWLKDYREKMGYYRHSNIERVQYVYHDKNTKNMNEEERRQLNLILKSVDEGISLPYSTKTKKIDFSKIE